MVNQDHVAQIVQTRGELQIYKVGREYNLTEYRLRVLEKKDINTQAMRSNNNDKRKTH